MHLPKNEPGRASWCLASMLLLILVGAWLHIGYNMTGQGSLLGERFIRGAPILAPLLFANMGLLGLIVLLDPHEGKLKK